MKETAKIGKYQVIFVLLAIGALFFSIFFLQNIAIYIIVGVIYLVSTILALPFISHFKKKKSISKNFPIFLRDIAQECEAGATLPQAIKSTAEGSYGELTEEIKKMVYQLSLGVTVEKTLLDFSNRWNIVTVNRSITSILEAEKAGGSLYKTLNSVANSVYLLEELKSERRSQAQGFMSSSYMIYFILIGVLFVLIRILNSFSGAATDLAMGETVINFAIEIKDYVLIFQELLIIQGIFTGLAIGQTSEGDFKAGLIHALILSSIGFFSFTLLINLFML